MKRIFSFSYAALLVTGMIVLFDSCSNDFELVSPQDPGPVVCFRMDPADRIFHLTLTKTFSGNGSGFDLAKEPERVFYENPDIRLEAWQEGYKVWETPFGVTEQVKSPGVFPEIPGYCYVSKVALPFVSGINGQIDFHSQISEFRLVINQPGKLGPAVSRIPVIPLPLKLHPSAWEKSLDLYPGEGNFDVNYTVRSSIRYCELICVFRYQELHEDWEDRSVTFALRKNIQIIDNMANTYVDPDLFFNKLLVNIKPIDSTLIRKFRSLDIIFLAGDQYYKDYLDTYENTGNSDSPPVGNIENGIGLFTMVRSVRIDKMGMTYRTLDSLAGSVIAKPLGFVKW